MLIRSSFLKLLSHFRLRWGVHSLYANPVDFSGSKENLDPASEVASLLSLDGPLPAGWYMAEIRLESPKARTTCEFYPGEGREIHLQNGCRLPLYSGRTCKRLLRIKKGGGTVHVGFSSPISRSELVHFRLTRVSGNFSKSRMLRKLQALHPHYKTRKTQHASSDICSVWSDYCALFEERSEIISYSRWLDKFGGITPADRTLMAERIANFSVKPLISVLMPVFNTNAAWLDSAINSVRKQVYDRWELCIADDASTDAAIKATLVKHAKDDLRIKVVFREKNGHISAASNSALEIANGEWLALLDHDDLLSEDALFWVVETLNRHPTCRLIYSDEDKIDGEGVRSEPHFKSDWNPDLFYSQNMFSHLGVYETSLVREVGGFRSGVEGSQDYDLALRCVEKVQPEQIKHIPRVLYHWRIHSESTAQSLDAKPYAVLAGEKALQDHFDRCGISAEVRIAAPGYRVRYSLPPHPPLVSLIIPTRNGLKLLRRSLESILNKTDYPNYEIILLDNGSDEPASIKYIAKAAQHERVRVIRDDSPFNYSALNNRGVDSANGEIVGLINNDIEVINGDWLTEMVSHAIRPGVGAVGAKLWYGDRTIQHAGIVLGLEGFASHIHRYLSPQDFGYCGRAALIQSFSALTGACLVVRKSLYQSVGGLDECNLPVACNDLDFCLKLHAAGYRNVWTPYAELYHHESSSRGFDDTPKKLERARKEIEYMWSRWRQIIENDPAYNPNLSLDHPFDFAWPPRIAPLSLEAHQPSELTCPIQ